MLCSINKITKITVSKKNQTVDNVTRLVATEEDTLTTLFTLNPHGVADSIKSAKIAVARNTYNGDKYEHFAIGLTFNHEKRKEGWSAIYYAKLKSYTNEPLTRVLTGFLSSDVQTIEHLQIALTSEDNGYIIASINVDGDDPDPSSELWMSDFYGLPINVRPGYHGSIIYDDYNTRIHRSVVNEESTSLGNFLMAVQGMDADGRLVGEIEIFDGIASDEETVSIQNGNICTVNCQDGIQKRFLLWILSGYH